MTRATVCPVCGGAGRYTEGLPLGGRTTGAAPPTYPCRGCGGRGWVEIEIGPDDTMSAIWLQGLEDEIRCYLAEELDRNIDTTPIPEMTNDIVALVQSWLRKIGKT